MTLTVIPDRRLVSDNVPWLPRVTQAQHCHSGYGASYDWTMATAIVATRAQQDEGIPAAGRALESGVRAGGLPIPMPAGPARVARAVPSSRSGGSAADVAHAVSWSTTSSPIGSLELVDEGLEFRRAAECASLLAVTSWSEPSPAGMPFAGGCRRRSTLCSRRALVPRSTPVSRATSCWIERGPHWGGWREPSLRGWVGSNPEAA